MLATVLAGCAGLNVRFLFPDFIFMPLCFKYFKYIRAHTHEVLEVGVLEVDICFMMLGTDLRKKSLHFGNPGQPWLTWKHPRW